MQAAPGASLNPSDRRTTATAPRSRRRHLGLFAAVAASAYAVDVVTKIVAVERLTDRPPVPLVGDALSLYLTYNSGAAFSFLTGHTEVLSTIAIAAVLAVLWVARRLGSTGWAIALGFLLGGVTGNLTDRLLRDPAPFRGHVVDFLMLPNFPVFNMADVWINIAAGAIVLQSLRGIGVDGGREAAQASPDGPADRPEQPGEASQR